MNKFIITYFPLFILVVIFVFWGVVGYVAIHFLAKIW